MTPQEKWHYVEDARLRYHTSNKRIKKQILDEFCAVCGYSRKYAIVLFNKGSAEQSKKRRGPKRYYEPEELLEPLERIWLATDMMCGKRLKVAMPIWLPYYDSTYGPLTKNIKKKLLNMSAATIDRLLRPCKQLGGDRGISGTRPGYLLKNQIEIKTDHWDVERAGFMEADTVAHCGNSLKGDFVWSITLIDIHTGWTELRATWNKGAHGVCEQIADIENDLPFKLRGFDCDNGSEFLNHHLLRYLQKRKEPVQFTRSRPYRKNDNAHVEQKNWTGVRHVFGYYRLDKKNLVELMNDIYKNEWHLLINFFYPSMKLKEKVKVNSKYKRKHHPPMTAYERLVACEDISKKKKQELKKLYESLNPFELRKNLEKKLKHVFSYVDNLKANPKRKI